MNAPLAPCLFGTFRLEPAERRLLRRGEVIHLQNKTFELLVALVGRAGHVMTKEELLAAVWPGAFIEEGVLTVHVAMLRKAFGDEDLIATVPKVGYRFTGIVRPVDPPQERVAPEPASPLASPPTMPSATPLPAPAASGRRLWVAVAAAAILAIAVGGWFAARSRSGAAEPPSSLAVLPFSLLESDDQASYLQVGMADAIIGRLTSSHALRIPPTVVIRRFAELTMTPAEAGRQLDVEAVLTGTIQRSDGRLRVTVQVTNVGDGAHLWAARFDEPMAGIFSMQDAIAEQISEQLVLDAGRSAGNWRRETGNLAAYELYLKGRESWARRTPASIRAGIEMFEQAVALDPSFARAYAGIADSYSLTASGLRAQDRFPKAKAAALTALELDESLAEAHNALAFISYKWEWQWAAAEREFRRALELDPDYVLAHHWYGEYLSIVGRHDEAVQELRRAQQLDPFSTPIQVDIGAAHGRAGRATDAIAAFEEGLKSDPSAAALHSGLWSAFRMAGREQEAFEALVRFRTLGGATANEVAAMRDAFARGGSAAVLRADLDVLIAADARGDSRALNLTSLASTIARTYAMLGDRDNALTWLEEATRRRDDGPLTTRTGWYWHPYRDEPRFKAVERLVGMPEAGS